MGDPCCTSTRVSLARADVLSAPAQRVVLVRSRTRRARRVLPLLQLLLQTAAALVRALGGCWECQRTFFFRRLGLTLTSQGKLVRVLIEGAGGARQTQHFLPQ